MRTHRMHCLPGSPRSPWPWHWPEALPYESNRSPHCTATCSFTARGLSDCGHTLTALPHIEPLRHCIELHGISAWHCIAWHDTAALIEPTHCIALRCVASRCFALICFAWHRMAWHHCHTLRCVTLHRMAWLCTSHIALCQSRSSSRRERSVVLWPQPHTARFSCARDCLPKEHSRIRQSCVDEHCRRLH
jgi:hypothetical protein